MTRCLRDSKIARAIKTWLRKSLYKTPLQIKEIEMEIYELIEITSEGKIYSICIGTYAECVDCLESLWGITFYDGVELNGSRFVIEAL